MPETVAPTGRICACGCERSSARGEFIRGHAVRHALALRAAYDTGDQDARNELQWRGWSSWNPSAGTSIKNAKDSDGFGVEAEFFGMPRRKAVELLTAEGLASADDGYNHHPAEYWRITHDASVATAGTGESSGNELVSPVLRINRKMHFKQVQTALHTLRDNGGDIDKTCGLHVHHSAAAMTPLLLAETLAHYAIFQRAIDSILPKSRRVTGGHTGSGYSKAVENLTDINEALRRPGTSFREAVSLGNTRNRYQVVNLNALDKHGTVEFRQHSGTLNAAKTNNWVKLTRLFMDIGRTQSIIHLLKDFHFNSTLVSEEFSDIIKVLEYMGADDMLTEYFIGRRDAFSGKTEDDEDKNACSAFNSRRVPRASTDPNSAAPSENAEWCASCAMWHIPEYTGR